MKRCLVITFALVMLLTLTMPVSYAQGATVLDEKITPREFARTYEVSNVSASAKVIVDDPNTKSDKNLTCSFKSTEGPTEVKIRCYFYSGGGWNLYSSSTISLTESCSFYFSGGERFKLTVQRTSGSDGWCKFGVTLV